MYLTIRYTRESMKKTNAIRLLEYVGFPGQIVSDAERIYQMLASE